MELKFRTQPKKEDIQNVRTIVESTGFFHDHEIDVAVELIEEKIRDGEKSDYQFLFAEINGETVGYACYGLIACTKSSYDLFWLATSNNHRGKGIGKKILAEMYKFIKSKGGTAVYAETSEKDQYIPTRHFYESNNFIKEAVLKDFYDIDDSKAIYVIYI